MTRQLKTTRLRWALLSAAAIVAGCQSGPKIDSGAELRAQEEVFRQHLVETTDAIHVGDLAQANTHLHDAREIATTPEQTAKVDSLDALITGAQALMMGDVELAQTSFAAIGDPALGLEVRAKAGNIGIAVPELVASNEEQP